VTPFLPESLERLRLLLRERPAIEIPAPHLRRASVLIPLIRDAGNWSVLFSRRADHLSAHGGQIAFPGGAVEVEEPLADAALREAEEEVGIPRGEVELIGRLDDVITNSGFLVAPFVGIVGPSVSYVIQESEVAEVFEVPLEALLAIDNPEVRYVTFRGVSYPAYFYHHRQYEIWGLTGRMLKAFLDLVWVSL
jgi:8-oxo-dGTP pyrophosphatase MutT (NUDIX family)